MAMIFPPRPEKAVDRSELPRYERLGWLAQLKMNGTCSVVETTTAEPFCYTRHREPHKLWNPRTSKALIPIRDLESGTILVGELLHSKVAGGPKDTLYLFDIVAYKGKPLYGMILEERLALLRSLFKIRETKRFYEEVTDNLWISRGFSQDFLETFLSLNSPEQEGLVLKNPKAKLLSCLRKSENAAWQIKCRRPHANFSM